MVEYQPATCAYCSAETWCEERSDGTDQCRACKIERFFERVLYPPLGYKLQDWQRKILRALYGSVDARTGLRQYRRSYISVAKQNGKSFLLGGLPIYHLLMENEPQPEAYGVASARDQASIVYKAAALLVEGNPLLKKRLKVLESTKRIIRRDGGGLYTVLSADGDVQDGKRPSLLLFDELHRFTRKKAETVRTVLLKGTGTRISEAVGLQLRHFDQKKGTIRIEQRHCRGDVDEPKTKNSKRMLALGTLVERYQQWITAKNINRPSDWIFFQEDDRSKPMWDSGVRKALKIAAVDAECDFLGFGLHSFRRANITMRQEEGGSAIEASKIAGHATVSQTGDYTIVQLKRQEELTRAIQNRRTKATDVHSENENQNSVIVEAAGLS